MTAPAITETERELSTLAHEVVVSGHAPADLRERLAGLSPLQGGRLTEAWSDALFAVRAHECALRDGTGDRESAARGHLAGCLAVLAGRLA
jgi:hypothetical protein